MAVVTYFDAAATELRRLAAVAARVGLKGEFAAALREMDERLRSDPEAWGDPFKDYPALRLTFYHHYGPLFIVKYLVHIDGTPVFIFGVKPTPESPLDVIPGSG